MRNKHSLPSFLFAFPVVFRVRTAAIALVSLTVAVSVVSAGATARVLKEPVEDLSQRTPTVRWHRCHDWFL